MAESHAKNPWKKILWISGGLISLLVAATIFARTYPSQMEQDVAAIHAMGYPTTDAEILALTPQQGDNADPIYQKYNIEYRKLTDAQDFKRLTYSSNRHPISAALRAKLVAQFRYLLPPIIEGSKMAQWVPIRHSIQPINAEAPWQSDLWVPYEPTVSQDAFRLLMQTAVVDMEAHNYSQAMEEFRAGQRMLAQMNKRPSPNAYFVASIADNTFVQALSTVVHEDPSRETLANVEKLLINAPPPPNARIAFEAEFVGDLIDIRARLQPEHGSDLWRTFQDRFWARGQAQRLANDVVHIYREAFSQLPSDPEDVAGMRRVFVRIGIAHSKDVVLLRAGVTNATQFWIDRCDRWFEQVARHRVLLAGVRVLKEPFPSYPLPGCGNDVIDPFSERPLIYKIYHSQFVVYSIGRNRVDDGGAEPSFGRPSDIVFRY